MAKKLTFEHVVRTLLSTRRMSVSSGAAAAGRSDVRFIHDLKHDACPWPPRIRSSFCRETNARLRFTHNERCAMVAVHLLTRTDLWNRAYEGQPGPKPRDYVHAGNDDTRDAWEALLISCTADERQMFTDLGELLTHFSPQWLAAQFKQLILKARGRSISRAPLRSDAERERIALFTANVLAYDVDRWVEDAAKFEASYNVGGPSSPPTST